MAKTKGKLYVLRPTHFYVFAMKFGRGAETQERTILSAEAVALSLAKKNHFL